MDPCLSPASEALIELVKCRCTKERCSTNHCQCRKAGLLCSCSGDDDDDDDDEIENPKAVV